MGLELAVDIITQATKAVAEITNFKANAMAAFERIDNSLLKLNKDGEAMDINFQRLGATLAFIGAVGGKAFQSMTDASPSLQIALFMIGVELENMWRSIGEELGPIIEEYLLPIFNTFSEAIQALPPDIKLLIGVLISVTVAITVLTVAIIALNAVSLPLVLTILAIAIVITAVIVLFLRWRTMATWLKVVLIILILPIAGLIFMIIVVIGWIKLINIVIKNWGDWMTWLGDKFNNAMSWIGTGFVNALKWMVDGIEAFFGHIYNLLDGIIDYGSDMGDSFRDGMGQGITGAIGDLDIFIDAFKSFGTNIGDVWSDALDAIASTWDNFTGFFSEVGNFFGDIVTNISETITDVVKNFINVLIDALIAPLNIFFEMMRTVLSSLGFSEDTVAKVPTLSVEKFHEGGTYMGNEGYIQVKGGERIRTATEEQALQNKLGGGSLGNNTVNVYLQLDNARFNDREDIDYLVSVVKDELTKDQYSRGAF